MENVGKIIQETIEISRSKEKDYIYLPRINLPCSLNIDGNQIIFQRLLTRLIRNAEQTYCGVNSKNKIILVISKIESPKKFSISITTGGPGFSFLEKMFIKQKALFFRENTHCSNVSEINKVMKKEFKAEFEVISQKGKGSTFKYIFPLN